MTSINKYCLSVILSCAALSLLAQSSWTDTGLPVGGTVREVYHDPISGVTLAATPRGLFELDAMSNIWSQVQDADAPNIGTNYIQDIFYSDYYGAIMVSTGYNIYISDDNGLTWSAVNPSSVPNTLRELEEDSDGWLYAATYGGVYVSSDQGDNWTLWNETFIENVEHVFMHERDGSEYLYFSGSSTFYSDVLTSNDYYEVLADGITTISYASMDGFFDDDMYFGSNGGIFKYEWDTDQFLSVNGTQATDYKIIGGVHYVGSYNGYVYTSADGAIYTTLRVGISGEGRVNDFDIFGGSQYLATEASAGLFRNNGGGWLSYNQGLRGYEIGNISVNPLNVNEIYLATYSGGIFKSVNNGGSWSNLSFTTGIQEVFIDPSNGDVYAYSARSVDGGVSFTGLGTFSNTANNFTFTSSGIFAPEPYAGIRRSLDGGTTWPIVYAYSGYDNRYITETANGNLIAVRRDNEGVTDPLVIRSVNGGDSWSPITVPHTFGYQIEIETLPSGTYIITDQGIWQTTDNGDTWQELPTENIFDIYDINEINGVLIIATYQSVYATMDFGQNWTELNSGLENNYNFRDIEETTSGTVYLGGLNKLYLFDGIVEQAVAPSDFKAKQISPNDIELFWTHDPANTGYSLYSSTDGGNNFSLITDTLTTTSQLILSANTGQTIYRLEPYNDVVTTHIDDVVNYRLPEGPAFEISPAEFTMDDEITVTYYTQNSYPIDDLVGADRVYFFSGVLYPENLDINSWTDIVGTYGVDDGIGEMTMLNTDTFAITFTPRDYYGLTGFQEVDGLAFVFTDPVSVLSGRDESVVDFVAHLRENDAMYELDGDGLDAGENGFDGMVNGAVPTEDRYETSDNAMRFDGDDNIITTQQFHDNQAFTISLWMQRDNVNNWQEVISYNYGGDDGLFLVVSSTNCYFGSWNYGTGYADIPAPNKVWEHFVLSYDGEVLELYVNGELLGSISAEMYFEGPLVMGSSATGEYDFFRGAIDEVYLYDYAIDGDAVWSIYQNFSPPYNFSATGVGDQEIYLTWDAISRPTATYYIYRDGEYLDAVTDDNFYYDLTVSNGVSYSYQIESEDDLGNFSNSFSPSVEAITYNGIEAVYKMDEYPLIDEGPFAYDGNVYGSVYLNVDRFDVNQSAYFFDGGVSDSISTSQTFAPNATFTVSTWVNWFNYYGTDFQNIVSWWESLTANAYLGITNSGEIRFTDNWTSTGVFIEQGRWTHIVAMYDGISEYSIYINGELAATTSNASGLAFSNFVIGAQGNTGENFSGGIDDITLFSRTLTAGEVLSLYELNNWPGTQFISLSPQGGVVESGAKDVVLFTLEATAPDSPSETLESILIQNIKPDLTNNLRLYLSVDDALSGDDVNLFSFTGGTLNATDINVSLGSVPYYLLLVGDIAPDASPNSGLMGFQLNESGITTSLDQLYNFQTQFASYTISGVNNDLVAYYPFDGSAQDLSGNGYNGTVNGAQPALDFNGNIASAYYFDGVDDVITSDAPMPSGDFTLSAYINFQNTDVTGYKTIIAFGDDNPFFGIIDGQLDLFGVVASEDPVPKNEWIMVSVASLNGVVTLYLNGEPVATVEQSVSFSGPSLDIGFNTGDGYFQGSMDEVRVYGKGLNGDQVKYLYLSTKNSIVANYAFDGTTEDHAFGYSNDAIAFGDPILTAKNRFNETGKAISFDGTDDYLEIPDADQLDFMDDFSVTLWMKSSATIGTLLARNSGSTGLELAVDPLGFPLFIVDDGTSVQTLTSDVFVGDGKWHFIVATKSSDKIQLSIDGGGANTVVASLGSIASAEPIFVGQQPAGTEKFTGELDDLVFYNRALQTNDIAIKLNESGSGFIFNQQKFLSFWSIGSPGLEYGSKMIIDSDDNIVLTGIAQSGGDFPSTNGGYDMKLVKVNPKTNQILFSQTIGGENTDYGTGIYETQNGDYLLTGYTYSTTGDFNGDGISMEAGLTRLSRDGDILWTRTMGGSGRDYPRSVIELLDGRIALVMYSNSTDDEFTGNIGGEDFVLMILNSDGSVVENTYNYGGTSRDQVHSATMTADGNLLLAGHSYSINGDLPMTPDFSPANAWIIKVNPDNGLIIWQQSIGGDDFDAAWEVKEDQNGDIVVVGESYSTNGELPGNYGDADAFVSKLASNGDILWTNNFGGTAYESGEGIHAANDGYYIVGYTESIDNDFSNNTGTSSESFLMKLDFDGNQQFGYTYGGEGYDYELGVAQAKDGRVYSIGRVSSPGGGDYSIFKGGSADMMLTNHYSDKVGLYGFEIATQSYLPTIDYDARTISISTLPGTTLGAVNTLIENPAYGFSVIDGQYFPNGPAGLIFEDFESNRHLTYEFHDGDFTQEDSNPSQSSVNGSPSVGTFVRNPGLTYNVIGIKDFKINLDHFIDGTKVFKMDVYTDAPAGTLIDFQFEDGSVAGVNGYPAGRRATFSALTTVQNNWETLEFPLSAEPDPSISSFDVDQLIILFAPNTNTDYTMLFDNLVGEVVDKEANSTAANFVEGSNTILEFSENLRKLESWTLNLTPSFYTGSDVIGMTVEGLIGTPSINPDNHTISASVANAVNLNALAPIFELSPGATINPTSGTTRNFTGSASNQLTYTVTPESGTPQDWLVGINQVISNEAEILNFYFDESDGEPVIDSENGTVDVFVIPTTDVTNISPTIDISAGASISPQSGIAQDYSSPVEYTVTAEDGSTTKVWSVNVIRNQSSEAEILGFSVTGLIGSTVDIDSDAATITGSVSSLVSLDGLTPSFTLSPLASISDVGVAKNFNLPVMYTVTAENGNEKVWTITLTSKVSSEANILDFTFADIDGAAEINASQGTIYAEALFQTGITSISPTIELSVGASFTVYDGSSPLDFSGGPLTFEVQAQDGSTKNWEITVVEAGNFENDIVDFTFTNQVGSADINTTDHTVTAQIMLESGWPSVTPSITVSDGASISPESGTTQDYTSSVNYTVTAGNGDQQNWSVSIQEISGSDAEILSFVINVGGDNYTGVRSSENAVVEILLPEAADLSSLEPTIEISPGATIDLSGPQNFNNEVVYRVTSGDESTFKDWTAYARKSNGDGSFGASFGQVTGGSYAGSGSHPVSAPTDETGSIDQVKVFVSSIEDDGDYEELGNATLNGDNWEFSIPEDEFDDIGVMFYFEGTYLFANEPQTATSNIGYVYVNHDAGDNEKVVSYSSAGNTVNNYRIIAFPFENPNKADFTAVIGETDESKWRLAQWNGSNYSYNPSNLEPGIGYFFISTKSQDISMGGQSVALPFSINLSSGWNLIGNPFFRGLDWNAVYTYNRDNLGTVADGDINGNGSALVRYNGSFSDDQNVLNTYEGAFVYANSAISGFEFPLSAMNDGEGGREVNNSRNLVDVDVSEWMIDFSIETKEGGYHVAGIGIQPNATNETDKFDLRHLPMFEDYIFADIEGVARNVKSAEDLQKWTFTLPNNHNSKSITLTWDEVIGSQNTLIFVDGIDKRIIDLKEESELVLKNNPSAVHSVYFGVKEEIFDNLNLDFVAIHNLYPNPVIQELTLDFYSPEGGFVGYEIVSMDGKVSFIDNMQVQKGLNRLKIEDAGTRLSDGIYFLRIEGFDNQAVMTKFVIR